MPDISPELAARIEQLRSSHQENPARFFMPLASAYREAGELGQAEELLRENLKRHPGYLSAHVLLGRCLADRGALGEARNEFGYVLSIDPQNLIALRTLGEMAASSGNHEEARRWYGELLSVDPMSVEARQALDALEATPPAPAAPTEGAPGAWDPFAHGDVSSPADSVADEPAPAASAYGEASLHEPELMDAPGFGAETNPAGPAPELGFGAVDLPAHSDAPVREAGSDPGGWGDVSLDGPVDLPSDLPAAPKAADAFDFGAVELSDDWSATPDPAPEPLAADPAAGWGAFEETAPAQVDAAPEARELRSFHDEEGLGEEEVEMVTETMAELYYRQGFVDRAADVYRELIARRGDEPALVGRLAELETELNNPAADDLPLLDVAPRAEDAADTSWLTAVDAHVAGAAQAEPLPSAELPDAQGEVQEPRHGAAGDAFADSFAAGFGGVADGAGMDTPPVAPSFEVAEPADELPHEPIALAEEPADEREPLTAPIVEPAAPAAETARAEHRSTDGTESVATYLWSVLSWRPGQPVVHDIESYASDAEPAAAAPLEYTPPEIEEDAFEAPSAPDTLYDTPAAAEAPADAGAPPPAEPWDDLTLGAPEQQPPLDGPWMADAPSAAAPGLHPAEEADEPWAIPAAPTEEMLPADDAASPVDELPWLAAEPSVDDFAPAGTEAAGSAADEPMPWEMGLDVPAQEATPAPAEPVAGFSFEDFFSEPDAAPVPAPAPEPAPAPAPLPEAAPAPAPQAQAADDDEDLESFQAWLQSLKR